MRAESPSPPRYRTILALDIEGSTARTNSAKAWLRTVMYELLEAALHEAGIAERHRDRLVDRGDGVLVLIHPVDDVPKTALLNSVVPALTRLLREHDSANPDRRFRLRAVVHAGEVHYDQRGCFGEALDIAFRLLDAPAVKHRLERTTAPIVLVVSDDIYRCVVRHGYDGIDDHGFEPIVNVTVADTRHRGWVQVPGEDAERRLVDDVVARYPTVDLSAGTTHGIARSTAP
jgi:class 3 adenylate cyclase